MKPIRIASLVGLSLTIGCLLVLIGTSASATRPSKTEFAPSATGTFYAFADSYVYSVSPTQTHGSDTILYVGSPSSGAAERALFRFDLSSLPTDAIVDSAVFRAYMTQAPSSPPLVLNIGVYRITAAWNEPSVHWSNQPPAASIGKSTGVSMTVQYYDWDIPDLAQVWVSNPGNNFGLELRSESDPDSEGVYAAGLALTQAERRKTEKSKTEPVTRGASPSGRSDYGTSGISC